MSSKHSAGKGDTYRYVDHEKYSKNYDLIFKKGKINNEQHKNNGTSNRRTNNGKRRGTD